MEWAPRSARSPWRLAALMSWWYGAMQQRSRRFAVVTGRAYRPKIIRLGRRAFVAWCFIGLYLVLAMVLPIALLIWSSLLPFFQLPSPRAFAAISLTHYFTLPWELVINASSHTALLAILTPSLTLAVSLAFSWIVLRSRIPGRAGFDFIAFLPHAVPSIVFGVGALLHYAVRHPARGADLRNDLDPAHRVCHRAA